MDMKKGALMEVDYKLSSHFYEQKDKHSKF